MDNRIYRRNFCSKVTFLKKGFPLFILFFLIAVGLKSQQATYVGFQLDNDILYRTDRDYTHGTALYYANQKWAQSFLKKAFMHSANLNNIAGLSLVSKLYTPDASNNNNPNYNDRPYTATLELGLQYIAFFSNFRVTSEIRIGLIGECAMGKQIQNFVHRALDNQIAPGWNAQMSCNPLASYQVMVDLPMIQKPKLDIYYSFIGCIGLPSTEASGGLFLRAGKFYPYLKSVGIENAANRKHKHLSDWQFYFKTAAYLKVVVYDATLSGGIINRENNPYLLPTNAIQHLYPEIDYGLYGSFKSVNMALKSFVAGKSFESGRTDKWVSLQLLFAF